MLRVAITWHVMALVEYAGGAVLVHWYQPPFIATPLLPCGEKPFAAYRRHQVRIVRRCHIPFGMAGIPMQHIGINRTGDLQMPVISFASPKGGVGKSTSALLLASGLTAANASVTVIDGDPNRTLQSWAESTKDAGFEVKGLPADDEIIEFIEVSAAKSQFVIVDLEGTANLAMSRAISRTDLVIIPLQASPVDARQASRAIRLVVSEGRALRRTIPYRMLFTRVNPAIPTRDEKEIRAQFADGKIPAFETAINDRAAFRAMFTHYVSLWDLKSEEVNGLDKAQQNAAKFVREVTEVIRNLMENTEVA